MDVNLSGLGGVIAAESQAVASSCCADGGAGFGIMRVVWFGVSPHHPWNSSRDLYSGDCGEFRQLEPQYDSASNRSITERCGYLA